ncbi:MAG: ABC transporter ATP-binding protein [Gammaproteobacteria bacterium]|nr:ABC transporter ATP-binding protein [Gammaproteobacteria bacterium]
MSSSAIMLDQMPSAMPAMWRALKRGYDAEPALLVVAFILSLLAALPDALFALWLALLAMGITNGDTTLLWTGVIGLGLFATLTWGLKVISDRTQRKFRDRVSIALESHVAKLQASVITVAHHERPEYLDRLSILRNQVFVLDHMYMSIFSTAGWFLRLGVTGALLVTVHPALLLLVLFALPTVLAATWRPAVERATEEKAAPHDRRAKHLFDLATTAGPGKEVRLSGIEQDVVRMRRSSWDSWYRPVSRARTVSSIYNAFAWTVFGTGFVLAVVFVVYGLEAGPGPTLLLLGAGSRLSAYISATVGELGFLRGIWMDGSKRLAWLEDYADFVASHANLDAPSGINQGIEFKNVTFAYPGTSKNVLEHVNLKLKAGSVIALIGANGAGKSTLVKLLAKMYEPDSGEILVDCQSLSKIKADSWRNKLAGAFQDFFRFEFQAQYTVGVGDKTRLDDTQAVSNAVGRAGAESVIKELPEGVGTQLGVTWPKGVEVSFGQWQKLSLARGFMRDEPLLLILDEPTAALDAETEHGLFERYASAAQSPEHTANGRVTLLVSHRFSTVRMADQIVVLDGAKVVETGSHDELMSRQGQYAELYNLQASAYQ